MFLKSQKYLLTPDSVNLPDNVPKKRHNTSAAFQQLIYVMHLFIQSILPIIFLHFGRKMYCCVSYFIIVFKILLKGICVLSAIRCLSNDDLMVGLLMLALAMLGQYSMLGAYCRHFFFLQTSNYEGS